MNNLKKITLELPESAFLMDITYYWKNKTGTVKANGMYDENSLKDGNTVKAWSNTYAQTEERDN